MHHLRSKVGFVCISDSQQECLPFGDDKQLQRVHVCVWKVCLIYKILFLHTLKWLRHPTMLFINLMVLISSEFGRV